MYSIHFERTVAAHESSKWPHLNERTHEFLVMEIKHKP